MLLCEVSSGLWLFGGGIRCASVASEGERRSLCACVRCVSKSAIKLIMHKYTKRGSNAEEVGGGSSSSGSGVAGAAGGGVAPSVPEPIRRWHSFHSRRSSVGNHAQVTGSVAATSAAATVVRGRAAVVNKAAQEAAAAARFLSPPPALNSQRRRFSVW